jgi:hypothetical protein
MRRKPASHRGREAFDASFLMQHAAPSLTRASSANLRRKTSNQCRGTTFCAARRIFDLNGAANRLRSKNQRICASLDTSDIAPTRQEFFVHLYT